MERRRVDFPPPAGPKSTVMAFAGIRILIFLRLSAPSEYLTLSPSMMILSMDYHCLRARAYENCVFIVAVNKAGKEDETNYLGQSMIISPLGGKIMTMSEKDECDIIFAELDLDKLQEARDELPVNRDRRSEFYSILAQSARV